MVLETQVPRPGCLICLTSDEDTPDYVTTWQRKGKKTHRVQRESHSETESGESGTSLVLFIPIHSLDQH